MLIEILKVTGVATPEGVVRFLHDVCDPYLRLFRRVLPPLGPIDVSPIVAVVALVVVERLVNGVLLENLK